MKTTPAHFKKFVGYAKGFASQFGLADWEITFSHTPLEGDQNARTGTDLESRKAIMQLATDWTDPNEPPTDEWLRRVALHETMHIVMSPMFNLFFEDRRVAGKEIEAAEHGAIMRFMTFLREQP